MDLSEAFAAAIAEHPQKTIKDNNTICFVTSTNINVYTVYDFISRQIITARSGSESAVSVIQFKDADRQVLQAVYAYMVQSGKTPVPLPEIEKAEELSFSKGAFTQNNNGGVK